MRGGPQCAVRNRENLNRDVRCKTSWTFILYTVTKITRWIQRMSREATQLFLLLNKLHLFSLTQNRFNVIQFSYVYATCFGL